MKACGIFAFFTFALIGTSAAVDGARGEACLYAVYEGNAVVDKDFHCMDGDRSSLAANSSVQHAIEALGINAFQIHFAGCPNAKFRVYPDGADGSHAYILEYPSNSPDDELTAPAIHELGHVLQMEMNGGSSLALVDKYESKRIELGADYIAGVLFGRLFPEKNLNLFQQNLLLTGVYRESPKSAHGTPAQRTAAFRNGVFGKESKSSDDYRALSDNFQRDIYGWVSRL